VRFKQTTDTYHRELNDHVAPLGVAERPLELLISSMEKLTRVEIALVATPRRTPEHRLEVIERTPSEPLERQLSEFAGNPPVNFRDVLHGYRA
jgi:hypothetical protein